ncbi:MAG TPA: hypothetical protein VG709_01790 [Actinomycetota bacterium]|nr:hypothetical protein [Actinomycetota bacterium]
MDEVDDRLQDALATFEELAHETKPPEAWRNLSEPTVEKLWQAWPDIRAWGEWMFQLIDGERRDKATPVPPEAELDETGGGG